MEKNMSLMELDMWMRMSMFYKCSGKMCAIQVLNLLELGRKVMVIVCRVQVQYEMYLTTGDYYAVW